MTAAPVTGITLASLLEAQQGVLARRQALAAGLTPDQWRWKLSSRRWQQLLPGVAVTHNGGTSFAERSWAAVLFCGDGAALTGDAALIALGMKLPEPELWHVVTPLNVQHRAQLAAPADGLQLRVRPHRLARLAEVVHPVRLPPDLRPGAAVLHAAAWASSARIAEARLASAVQQRVVTPAQVRAAAAVLGRTHRRRLVSDVLQDVELGAHARSELELLKFLRRFGLPLPDRLQLVARAGTHRYYLDAWWERQQVSLEMDGSHHRDVGTWEADLLRGNRLAVARRDRRVLQLRMTPGHLRHEDLAAAEIFRDALL